MNNNVIQNTLKLKIGYSHIHTTTDDVENGKRQNRISIDNLRTLLYDLYGRVL